MKIDDIVNIKLKYSDYEHKIADSIIKTGHVFKYNLDISNYPIDINDEDITEEIREKALAAYNDALLEEHLAPFYADIDIIPVKEEYKSIAKTLYDLIHHFEYEEREY